MDPKSFSLIVWDISNNAETENNTLDATEAVQEGNESMTHSLCSDLLVAH